MLNLEYKLLLFELINHMFCKIKDDIGSSQAWIVIIQYRITTKKITYY